MKTLDRSLAMMPINQLCTVGFLWVYFAIFCIFCIFILIFRGFILIQRAGDEPSAEGEHTEGTQEHKPLSSRRMLLYCP